MSQLEVYRIIKDCGGIASLKQIKTIAKRNFPNTTLYSYVGDRLKKLEKKGVLKKNIDSKEGIVWEIIDTFN